MYSIVGLIIWIGLPALLAGLVQGVTGFGAGIIMMLIFPYIFPVPQAAALTGIIALSLSIKMAYQYRQDIQYRLIWLPTMAYVLAGSIAISLSTEIDARGLKIGFGIFLIVLSLYLLKASQKLTIKPTFINIVIVGLISGLCDGFFGIGGPLMVVLYLALTPNLKAYLGTIQLFFVLTAGYAMVFRIFRGIITADMTIFAVVGIMAILIGLVLGNAIIKKVNAALVTKLTYLLIGFSGLVTLFSTLLGG